MSLDVYLSAPAGEGDPPTPRIFVRRDGGTVEISRAEWDELNPGREPFVLTVDDDAGEREVYWANITHNLGLMARECGLYEPLWRPVENGITHARQLVEPLS